MIDDAALVGELTMKSPEFVAMWRGHRMTPCDAANRRSRSREEVELIEISSGAAYARRHR
jgi:hypothetical protein